jgi:NADPH-dependent glutamate synthase beta subunit-like oxidoreductase/NAD(P)H-flavin reductase
MPLETPINSIFKIEFSDLYNREGLQKINQYFLQFLSDADANLYQKYLSALANPNDTNSELLIAVGKVLEEFLVLFFNIKLENSTLQNQHSNLANLYVAKRLFVQRRVAKKYSSSLVSNPEFVIPTQAGIQIFTGILDSRLRGNDKIDDFELELANQIAFYLTDETKYSGELEELEKYCAWALFSEEGQEKHKNGTLFKLPKKIDFENLVELETVDGIKKSPEHHLKNRDGFKLTDQGCNLAGALNEANYCIFCHNQNKDSCRSGLKEKDNSFKKDLFKTELSGCPLDEKISEMNLLKSEGKSIAALAMAIIDNPMIAGTGHRICNDCMKSCIYQKQEPVNIPQVETRTLKDVLNLPFGFEIYSLLTRWNPLNLARVLQKEPSGYKVLVAGLGPSGYTLAHHLLNEGHLVVGVDGLKIEPLNPEISGIDLNGNRHQFKPIKDIKEIYEELDERQIGGFGGVAEYGITVRWDKNFLKIIRLLLERRAHFRMFGGFRLGSGLDCYDALKETGFDHVALCLGAGWVKIPEIKNNFLKGIRMASDFLMSLQLTGAERKTLPSNLQLRLPVLVVGSGLTAIDTACEALAYYPKQVENFAHHYQILCKELGKDVVEKSWNEEDKLIAKEFLEHFSLIELAKSRGENIAKLLQKLGGAKIIYRKRLQDSPAYRLNHEEVQKAFEEGIEFIENATPIEAVDDGFGQIKSLKILVNNQEQELPAGALFLAAGTTPNKAPFYEDKLKFELDGGTFQIINLLGEKLPAINSPKGDGIGFICAKNEEGKTVSFFGDLHPSFNGSVVKAMASAKNGYPTINQSLQTLAQPKINYEDFLQKINQDFAVKVKELNILSDYFIELVVHAPLLAQKTKLGHIFRLHNYHSLAKTITSSHPSSSQRQLGSQQVGRDPSCRWDDNGKLDDGTLLAMEGVAVTTYKVNPEAGTITVMIVNVGGSSSMVKNLQVGEPIIFMGPTGTPTHILENKTVVLIAGGRGIFPLAGLAQEYKKNNCRVIFFCGFHKKEDLMRQDELRNSCSELILDFGGDLVLAVVNYFKNTSTKIDAVLTMGNDQMMHKVAQIYHGELKENLNESSIGITSLNSPMQCMLKGVCSQCLQRKIDKNGNEKFFYACLGQDQKLAEIDFQFLTNRCRQNSLPEKLMQQWLKVL